MSEIYLKTASRAAILTAIAAGTLDKRRPTIEADGGRFRVGNHAPTETAIEAIAFSTAGTTTLALQSQCADHVALVAVSAGAGAYTRKLVIPRLATALDATTLVPLTGDTVAIRVALPASANPAIEIRENTESGTTLITLAGTGSTFVRTLHFIFTGGAWVLLDAGADSTAAADLAAAVAALTASIGGKQPLDADLTAIAALTTAGFGRGLLALADAAALRTAGGLGSAATLDADTDTTLAANSDAKFATQKAVKAYVLAVRDALVNAAPGALDTLRELADKLADDDDALAVLTAAVAAKATLVQFDSLAAAIATKSQIIRASGVLSGNTDAGSAEVSAAPASSYIDCLVPLPFGATYAGAWDSGTSYATGDFVRDGGHLWLAFATPSGPGTAPGSDPASWENRDSTVQVRLTLDGVTGSLLTITTAASGAEIALNLAGNESQAFVTGAIAAGLSSLFPGLGIILTDTGAAVQVTTPGTGSNQVVAITSASGIFSASGATNTGVDYVAAVAASGAINEVELIAAAGGKKVKMVSAWTTGTLPDGEMKLSVKHGGTYTDITPAVMPGGTMHVMPPDDNGGGATPSVFLTGLDAGESLVARRTATTGLQAGATCRVEVLAEQSA